MAGAHADGTDHVQLVTNAKITHTNRHLSNISVVPIANHGFIRPTKERDFP